MHAKWTKAVEVCLAVGLLVLAGCGQGSEKVGGADLARRAAAPAASLDAAAPVLNTFINSSIEIDQLGTGLSPDDANLFVGPDPADGSASAQKPTGGPATFIDWNDLGGDLANHKLGDATAGKDPTSFPQSNECVGSSQVLSKMDLTYVGVANNATYAYFAVQRANNNGDAGYYWLFTQKTPHLNAGQAPCKADQQRLLYDISGPSAGSVGDVLLGGHFHPNGTPLLRVFHATRDATGVTAVDAIDFTSSLWVEDPSGVAAVAVNTTVTAPGSWGSDGVLALTGGNLQPEIFAEAALPISAFTTGSVCGATFFGSVITRSSGSGGTSPDLKDLAGPALFNFGNLSATASLTATCGLAVGFQLTSATGFDGKPLANPSCSWSFDNGAATASTCSGSIDLPAGTHTATVTVTDPSGPPSCAATAVTNQITNFNPVTVSPSLAATCTNSFSYDATAGGGSGSFSYAWAFSGPGTVNPSSSTSKSGSVAVGTGGVTYTGAITVTDAGRTDGLICTASASANVRPLSPLTITLTPSATGLSCPGMTSDAVTYHATVGGGSGVNTITWTGNPALSCSGADCLIDPSDSTFCYSQTLFATVTDANALCGSKASTTQTYTKVTSVTATNLP